MFPKKNPTLKIILLAISTIAIMVFLGLAYAANLAKNLPSPEQITTKPANQSTKIYDRTGTTILTEVHGEERRTIIPASEIPDIVRKATIAIEDQTFYEHSGFDIKGIFRALINDFKTRKLAQGGSTITQQLAKNTFLTSEKTITRKIKELILAYWIEQRYSKEEIINLYLNQVPYGSNAYGIEAAAQTFFNKHAKDLTIAESANLAATLQAPSYYSPWGSHQQELAVRKNYVIDQMQKLGFISEADAKKAKIEKLEFSKPTRASTIASHFVVMVKDYLSEKYGSDVVETGGFQVITTIDLEMQKAAEQAVLEGAARNTENYKGHNAALVAEDPKTGQILALVGSKDYFGNPEPENCIPGVDCAFEGNFNVAVQGLRQPGSTFKPFAYLTAFTKGFSPATILFDLPTEFSSDPSCALTGINYNVDSPSCFHPQNFDVDFKGPISLKNALAQSINIVAVKVLYLAGLYDTIQTADTLGITTLKDTSRYGLSLVLGGGEVKLIDMVHAYSVFATEGIKHPQTFILEIKDARGKVLEKFEEKSDIVFDAEPIKQLNSILTDVEARSPLFSSSLGLTIFGGRPVALKTGTTNSYKDAWAMGYTPNLVVGVWAGNNNSQPMQKQGGSVLAAVPIWSQFLNQAFQKIPIEYFNAPAELSLPNKTMLNGSYVSTEGIHDILYYVNKDNPTGEVPGYASPDSQFWNWEKPVENWLRNR